MPRKTSIAFDDLAEEYLQKYAIPRKRSWRDDQRSLHRYWIPQFGSRQVHTIERREIVLALEHFRENPINGKKPLGTVLNVHLAIVRKMFNWAISQALLDANPCHMVGKPAKQINRERVLEMPEFEAIFETMEDPDVGVTTTLKMIVYMMALTGARRAEVCHMKWAEVDLRRATWTIRETRTKNSHGRVIPLSTQAVEILKYWKANKQRKGNPWVFVGRDQRSEPKPISPDSVNNAVVRIRQAVGFSDWTPHDIRRSAGTHMRRLGCDHHTLKLILGHSLNNNVTAIYDRYDAMDERREALQRWGDDLLPDFSVEELVA